MSEADRLQLPWQLVEHRESFEVRDATGQSLAFFYFESEPQRRRMLHRVTPDMARRLASQFMKLPEYIKTAKGDAL